MSPLIGDIEFFDARMADLFCAKLEPFGWTNTTISTKKREKQANVVSICWESKEGTFNSSFKWGYN